MTTFNKLAARHLGSANTYAVQGTQADETLLVALARSLAREHWNFNFSTQDFVGCDVWHAYEATFLTARGLPVSGTLKIVFDAHSTYIVESKSMKLYLNSFDMARMGETIAQGVHNYCEKITRDLSRITQSEVRVFFQAHNDHTITNAAEPFAHYDDLYTHLAGQKKLEKIIFTDFTGQRNHLQVIEGERGKIYERAWACPVLRARCRVTKQKDSGQVGVRIVSEGCEVDASSLLMQIVSMRETEEFHEFCAEKLFHALRTCDDRVREVSVLIRFARRGAIDINPFRASHADALLIDFLTPALRSPKTFMQ